MALLLCLWWMGTARELGESDFTWRDRPISPEFPEFLESPHDRDNNAVMFEVRANGYETKKVWLTCFDLQAALYVPGGGTAGGEDGSFHNHGQVTVELSPNP
jgi:hypothetical protein